LLSQRGRLGPNFVNFDNNRALILALLREY